MSEIGGAMLKVEKIAKTFTSGILRKTKVQALKDISFSLPQGKCLAIIGESGSGKTTLGRIILGTENPSGGKIIFNGRNLCNDRKNKIRKQIQTIPQDATASLNPSLKVKELLLEPYKITGSLNGNRERLIEQSLATGKLTPDLLGRYPHEISGGQRQRIAIARTLSLDPSLIIADEPAASLDRSIQAHVLSMLKEEVEENGKSLILITHDLRSVPLMADYVAVMYCGYIVEYGPASEIIKNPKHPYTQALASSVPGLRVGTKRIRLKGEPPSPLSPPSGCPLHPRCKNSTPECANHLPELLQSDRDHHVRCVIQ